MYEHWVKPLFSLMAFETLGGGDVHFICDIHHIIYVDNACLD